MELAEIYLFGRYLSTYNFLFETNMQHMSLYVYASWVQAGGPVRVAGVGLKKTLNSLI